MSERDHAPEGELEAFCSDPRPRDVDLGPITQARVAAAFEAWCCGWADEIGIGRLESAGNPFWDSKNETHHAYAHRLAAGLFKYLERVP